MELGVLEISLIASVKSCSEAHSPLCCRRADCRAARPAMRKHRGARACRWTCGPARRGTGRKRADLLGVDAAADPVAAIGLRTARGELHALARVAHGRNVCDVMGGRVQRRLQGAQTRKTCPEHVSHCSSSASISASSASDLNEFTSAAWFAGRPPSRQWRSACWRIRDRWHNHLVARHWRRRARRSRCRARPHNAAVTQHAYIIGDAFRY